MSCAQGAIDEEAIQNLSFIANLTKHIQLRTGGGDAEFATVKAAYLEELASDDEEEGHGLGRPAGGASGTHHAKGHGGKGKKQGAAAAPGAASKPAAGASAAAAAGADAAAGDDDEWGLGVAPSPAKPAASGGDAARRTAVDSDDDDEAPRAAAASATPLPAGGAAGKAPGSNRSGGLLGWFTGGAKSGGDGSKAPAHGTPSPGVKGATSPAARAPAAAAAACHDSDDDDAPAASRSGGRSGHAHAARDSDDDGDGDASDSDADEDDDDDGYGAALSSTKSGGSGGYIASLKAQQRAKRAAAKRQLAARLRDEARRSAGVRRAAAREFHRIRAASSQSPFIAMPLKLPCRSSSLDVAVDGDKGALSRTADEAEVSTFFPTFLWVLRDFTLDLVADDGFTSITPHEYLDECLAQTASGFSTEAQVRALDAGVLCGLLLHAFQLST